VSSVTDRPPATIDWGGFAVTFNLTVRHLALAGLVLSALLGPPGAASSEAATGPPGAATWTDVAKLGARPGADATAAVRLAIEHTPAGGLVFFPPGH
jgi:hypothetical protein